jgi:hypothetical protein
MRKVAVEIAYTFSSVAAASTVLHPLTLLGMPALDKNPELAQLPLLRGEHEYDGHSLQR